MSRRLTDEQYIKHGGQKCPVCQSEQIEGGFVEIDAGNAFQTVGCNECHAEWNDVYKLVGYGELEVSDGVKSSE